MDALDLAGLRDLGEAARHLADDLTVFPLT